MFKTISSAARTLLAKKAMHAASTSYFYSIGQAVWSNKDDLNFADNAYIKNVIAHRAINMIAHAASSVPFKLYQKIETKTNNYQKS
jgi:phage portal protein BeeE